MGGIREAGKGCWDGAVRRWPHAYGEVAKRVRRGDLHLGAMRLLPPEACAKVPEGTRHPDETSQALTRESAKRRQSTSRRACSTTNACP